MKTSIMLVPTLGNAYQPEMKQAIINFIGVMNVKPEDIDDFNNMPIVTYNGILSCDEKSKLQDYLNKTFAENENPIAIFFIEYNKEPEKASTLMFKEEYDNEKGY